MIEQVHHDIHGIYTVRESDSYTFSPSASALDLNSAIKKTIMETVEMSAFDDVDAGFVSSAAHEDTDAAQIHAANEFDERLSVAHWWSARTGFEQIIDARQVTNGQLYEVVADLSDRDFEIRTAMINNISGENPVCITILLTSDVFPRYVLGAKCSSTLEDSASGSVIEAFHSFIATKWLLKNMPDSVPAIDTVELEARFNQMRTTTAKKTPEKIEITRKTTTFRMGQTATVFMYADGFQYSGVAYKTFTDLTGKLPVVFSQPNF